MPKIGDIGTDKNGRKVVVTNVYADGTFDAAPAAPSSAVGDVIRATPPVPIFPGQVGDRLSRFLMNQVADIADQPSESLPMVGGQLGGMAFGAPGAAVGGGAGRFAANAIQGKPMTEGVATEAAMQGAINAIPLVGKPLIKAGTTLYRKTLAPAASDLAKIAKSSAMPAIEAAGEKLAETGIKYRLPITRGGVRKADAIVTSLDTKAKGMVADAARVGATTDPTEIRREAYGYLRDKFGPQAQTFSESDMAAARSKAAEFSRNPRLSESSLDPITGQPVRTLKPSVPVDEMDAIRSGTMRGVRNKYGQGIKDAATESEKAFGHAEREAITKSVDATIPAGQPSLSAVRGQEKDLLDLSKSLVRRQTNAANANLFRLYEFLGILGGNPTAIGLGAFSRPGVMSRVGIGMSDLGRTAQAVNPASVRLALLSMLGSKEE